VSPVSPDGAASAGAQTFTEPGAAVQDSATLGPTIAAAASDDASAATAATVAAQQAAAEDAITMPATPLTHILVQLRAVVRAQRAASQATRAYAVHRQAAAQQTTPRPVTKDAARGAANAYAKMQRLTQRDASPPQPPQPPQPSAETSAPVPGTRPASDGTTPGAKAPTGRTPAVGSSTVAVGTARSSAA
jgi:hypothetical protein